MGWVSASEPQPGKLIVRYKLALAAKYLSGTYVLITSPNIW